MNKHGAENEAGVFYAVKGRYKGQEVTVTHHDGAMVWLEDYGKAPNIGCWVPNDSVSYGAETEKPKRKRSKKK